MRWITRRAAAMAAAILTVCAMVSDGARADEAEERFQSVLAHHIAPRHEALWRSSQDLALYVASLCRRPTEARLTGAQDAHAAFHLALAGIAHIRLGPAAYASWLTAVDAEESSHDAAFSGLLTSDIALDALADRARDELGPDALAQLLHDATTDGFADTGHGERRCAIANALADETAAQASDLFVAWVAFRPTDAGEFLSRLTESARSALASVIDDIGDPDTPSWRQPLVLPELQARLFALRQLLAGAPGRPGLWLYASDGDAGAAISDMATTLDAKISRAGMLDARRHRDPASVDVAAELRWFDMRLHELADQQP